MKLLLFSDGRPGLLTDRGVVDSTIAVRNVTQSTGQHAMQAIIANFDAIRDDLNTLERDGDAVPLASVSLQAPLPHPDKILCMGGNFSEFGHRQPAAMWGFLKSPDAVIGPGGTVVLPPDDANIFHHEAELVLVFGRGGKDVKESDAFDHVFGYMCGVDVSARMPAGGGGGRPTSDSMPVSAAKSFDTFAPIGPWIVTKDEIADPQNVHIRLSVDGQLRGDFNTSDMSHSIAASIEFVTSHESIEPGDILYTGTNHQGLGAMQDGESIDMEIEGIGHLTFNVSDPLGRRWPKGVDQETAQDVREGTGPPGSKKRPL
jgi:2-keto-4-pentenoate hydratase/2-oxohepta-3-ene-1,7-dioic acid hydratase in catechol pathway